MEHLVTKSCKKVAPEYFCEKCDYTTSKKSSFTKHLTTSKHNSVTFGTKKVSGDDSHDYTCNICNKLYNSRHGLWYHKKKCSLINSTVKDESEPSKNDIIKQLIIQNQQLIFENKEFKEFMMEQSKHMMEQMIMKSTATESSS